VGTASTIAKSISDGSGSIVKTENGTWTLSATNGYTGGTSINGGTLQVAAANALGSSGTISFGGGTLAFSGAGSTNDYSSRFSTAATQQFNIDTNGQSVTFATALNSAGGSITKSGAGTLSLTANANSASGGTTVNGGSLKLTGTANAIGAISVNAGGTLQIGVTKALVNTTALTLNGGTLQIAGGAFSQDFGTTPLSLTAASVIDFGSGLGASAVSFGASGGQTWSGSLTITNYSTAGGDTLRFGTGSSGLTGPQLAMINFDGLGAQIDASGYVTPVPEPAAFAAALGIGALVFAGYRRRNMPSKAVL
jgi:autotransporter-associated beta strand protein